MADDVVVYWVTKGGTIYAADLVSRTYVGISSMERLGAAQRALDFAGIPHKDWGRAEPATMEEFGVKIRDADFLDGVINDTKVAATQARDHGAESRRMLGVLLGWNAPQAGSPEPVGLALLQNSLYATVIDKDSGAWYAVAPGVFWHLKNFAEVNAMRDCGLLARKDVYYDHAGVGLVRELALRPNDDLLPIPAAATYTVKPGDTFNAIAKQLGVTPDALAAANPSVTDRNALNRDQVLVVPK